MPCHSSVLVVSDVIEMTLKSMKYSISGLIHILDVANILSYGFGNSHMLFIEGMGCIMHDKSHYG